MTLPKKRYNADKKHPLYWTWNGMFIRCYYPSHKQFKDYGGRGVIVCTEWFSFTQFVRDVGPRPSPMHTLDRIDSNWIYDVDNVRWATKKQQIRNRRK